METFGVALPDNGVFHAVMTGKPYKYECWLNDFNSVPVVAYTVTRTLKVRQWWYCETNCTGCSTKDPDHISLQTILHLSLATLRTRSPRYNTCASERCLTNRKAWPYTTKATWDHCFWLGHVFPSAVLMEDAVIYDFNKLSQDQQKFFRWPTAGDDDLFYSIEATGLVPLEHADMNFDPNIVLHDRNYHHYPSFGIDTYFCPSIDDAAPITPSAPTPCSDRSKYYRIYR